MSGASRRGDGAGRFDVHPPNGPRIAVWIDGEGPAMVLVHGSLQDHSISSALVAELRGGITTFAVDRRGFGESGDCADYAIEREFEDIATVVDAVAARVGRQVAVWGHSYGASVAMGAAAMSANISHLVLYEPSLGLTYPRGWIEKLENVLAGGDNDAAMVLVLQDILEFTDDQIDAMRSALEWARRVAVASTVAREARAESTWVYRPGQFHGITAQTLLLSGSESTPSIKQATEAAAAAIVDARIDVLEGHAHIAHRTEPGLVAAKIREFMASSA